MDLASRRAALLSELEPFADHHERFQYVIDRARGAPSLPAELRLDQFLVEGCTSNLWLVPSLEDGVCRFRCDADSLITKGVATLVCELYDGASPGEVAGTDADFLSKAGITQHLSPNRRNGLSNLVGRIRGFGRAALGPSS
ncbi:MAG: SufE family protein [Opitutales bacterium]